MDKTFILKTEDYKFLYGKLKVDKIPNNIYEKIMNGDEFTLEEEIQIKKIIEKEQTKL